MRKTLFFLLAILLLTSCGAAKQNVTQKYISQISSCYSVELPEYSKDHSVFWDYILDNNSSFQQYKMDNSNFKVKNSTRFWNEVSGYSLPYTPEEDILIKDTEFAGHIVGTKYCDNLKMISLYPSGEVNAFALPNGVVYIYGGMYDLVKDDFDKYLGVVGHEVAHVLLKHAERHQYSIKKKEKKDNLMKGITTGLVIAAGGMAVASSINNDVDSEEFTNSIVDLSVNTALFVNSEIDRYALVKKYEYSREQEVEADIVALLFLKWLGSNPESYIELMEKMPDDNNENAEYRTHPTMRFRIISMKNFIEEPDRLFVVNGLQYYIPALKSDQFLEKYPDAVELQQDTGSTNKVSRKQDEKDDVYK